VHPGGITPQIIYSEGETIKLKRDGKYSLAGSMHENNN